MARLHKNTQEDLKRLLENMKKRLHKVGKETSVWVKKGEVKLSRLSKMGKLELDIVNLNMKKERLLKDIGKRVVDLGLSEEIGDPAIKNMSKKAKSIIGQSKKKRVEIKKAGKRLFKNTLLKKKK